MVGGELTRVQLLRGDASVDYGPASDRDLYLSVGDRLQLECLTPPILRVVPQKVW